MSKTFDSLVERAKKLREEMQEKGKECALEMFDEIFNKYPEISMIRWNQYTPYFNDGDPCYFNVYDMYFRIGEPPVSDDPYADEEDWEECCGEDRAWHYYSDFRTDPNNWQSPLLPLGESMHELAAAWHSKEGEQIAEMVWGDHVTVTATRNGFTTEEKYHD